MCTLRKNTQQTRVKIRDVHALECPLCMACLRASQPLASLASGSAEVNSGAASVESDRSRMAATQERNPSAAAV